MVNAPEFSDNIEKEGNHPPHCYTTPSHHEKQIIHCLYNLTWHLCRLLELGHFYPQTPIGIIRHWTAQHVYLFVHQVAHGSMIIDNFMVYQRMIIYTCVAHV